MGKRRERLNEGKKNIIAQLIQEYDIHTANVPIVLTHETTKSKRLYAVNMEKYQLKFHRTEKEVLNHK